MLLTIARTVVLPKPAPISARMSHTAESVFVLHALHTVTYIQSMYQTMLLMGRAQHVQKPAALAVFAGRGGLDIERGFTCQPAVAQLPP